MSDLNPPGHSSSSSNLLPPPAPPYPLQTDASRAASDFISLAALAPEAVEAGSVVAVPIVTVTSATATRGSGAPLPELTLFQRGAAASAGALVTSLLMTPFDVVKHRLQAQAQAQGAAASQPPRTHFERVLRGSDFTKLNLGVTEYWCPRCNLEPAPPRVHLNHHSRHGHGHAHAHSAVPPQQHAHPAGSGAAGAANASACPSSSASSSTSSGSVPPPRATSAATTITNATGSAAPSATASIPVNSATPAPMPTVEPKLSSVHTASSSSVPTTSTAAAGVDPKFSSARDALSQITRREGVRALWRGLTPALTMAVPSTAVYFAFYDKLRAAIALQLAKYTHNSSGTHGTQGYTHSHSHDTAMDRHTNADGSVIIRPAPTVSFLYQAAPALLAGTIARTAATTLTAPLELVRTRAQTTMASPAGVNGAKRPSLWSLVAAERAGHAAQKQRALAALCARQTAATTAAATAAAEVAAAATGTVAANAAIAHGPSCPLHAVPVPVTAVSAAAVSAAHAATATHAGAASAATTTVAAPRPSLWQRLQVSARTGGPAGLWRGLTATLWRDVPFSGIYWVGYEFLKPRYSRLELRLVHGLDDAAIDALELSGGRPSTAAGLESPSHLWASAFASGATAGAAAAVATHPFDVVKTRRQISLFAFPGASFGDGERVAASLLGSLRAVIAEDGLRGLYIGLAPRVAKVMPSCALMISSYELAKRWVATRQARNDDAAAAAAAATSATAYRLH